MAAIDAAARLDRDWLSRRMSDPASLRAQASRYRELKGRDTNLAVARYWLRVSRPLVFARKILKSRLLAPVT
jgi:hypothetical protein